MRMLVAVLLLPALIDLSAAEFSLKDSGGKTYGPFELKEGAPVRAGKGEWTVSAVRTDSDVVSNKLNTIRIPSIELNDATLEEALDKIRKAAAANDPEKKGVNLVLDVCGNPEALPEDPTARQEKLEQLKGEIPKVTLEAKDIKLFEILRITAMLVNMQVRVDGNQVVVCPVNAPDGPIITRQYNVMASFVDVTRHVSSTDRNDSNHMAVSGADFDLKELFGEMGVRWPIGSSVKFIPAIGKLLVANTASNLKVFEEKLSMLNVTPNQIETELHFVSFDKQDIAKLAPRDINCATLLGLWTNGHGELIAAPRSITQAGQATTFGGGIRHVYPTGLDREVPSATNSLRGAGAPDAGHLLIPGSTSSCTAGVSVVLMAQVTPEGSLLILTVSAELAEEPAWRQVPVMRMDSTGKTTEIRLEHPSAPVYPLETQVAMYNGSTVLIGGGMPLRSGQRVLYVFLTCRLIDPDGKPIRRHDVW